MLVTDNFYNDNCKIKICVSTFFLKILPIECEKEGIFSFFDDFRNIFQKRKLFVNLSVCELNWIVSWIKKESNSSGLLPKLGLWDSSFLQEFSEDLERKKQKIILYFIFFYVYALSEAKCRINQKLVFFFFLRSKYWLSIGIEEVE